MKANTYDNPRVIEDADTSALNGLVKWAPEKSLWFIIMATGWVVGGSYYFSWAAVMAFLMTCVITLCLGHSLGMHRKLIHQSFDCSNLLEKVGVWLGTLVGLGGPFTMMYTHDMRDWAQRQEKCHPFFSHDSHIIKDFWWQIHCKLHLGNTPGFAFPEYMKESQFYRFIDRNSWLQQIPLGLILFLLGDWGFVFWGICGRVTISIFGHWLVGYFAHNTGHKSWIVEGAAVQGHNVRFCGLITFGECWHNNHHAFPGSAKIGLLPGQSDPGWWVLRALNAVGLTRNFRLPGNLPERQELVSLEPTE